MRRFCLWGVRRFSSRRWCARRRCCSGLVTGLVVSVFQAMTQIQEPTLAFIPKIAVVALAMMLFGPFMLSMLTDFMSRVFTSIPTMVQ